MNPQAHRQYTTRLAQGQPDDGEEGRHQRGLAIAALARIEKHRLGYRVPSQSGTGVYVVNLEGEPFCSCPDFETRQQPCKHIFAVECVVQRETKPEGSTTYPGPLKVTYAQAWPAYNQAQRDEKREFMRLLANLCRLVPEPVQTFGRPRLLLADMVFAFALKVYSTVSGRRSMGDLEIAFERNYLSRLPHYNSVFNYLDNPALTPVLKQLIEACSAPLKSVETSFAVDSSGFSTSRFDRWYDAKYGQRKGRKQWLKAHIMVGTNTNVVTSVEVTRSNVHDAPMFAPLVDSTTRRFNVAEVTADKAYSSNRNLEVATKAGAQPFIPFKVNTVAGRGSDLWQQMYHFFMMHREAFLAHYHQRSNVETTFAMIKGKFGDSVRSKTERPQINEILLKVLCHNICCLILATYELGLPVTFWAESQHAPKVCEN